MRSCKFVGTMGAGVPNMIGAHFHTAGSMAGDSGTPFSMSGETWWASGLAFIPMRRGRREPS